MQPVREVVGAAEDGVEALGEVDVVVLRVVLLGCAVELRGGVELGGGAGLV